LAATLPNAAAGLAETASGLRTLADDGTKALHAEAAALMQVTAGVTEAVAVVGAGATRLDAATDALRAQGDALAEAAHRRDVEAMSHLSDIPAITAQLADMAAGMLAALARIEAVRDDSAAAASAVLASLTVQAEMALGSLPAEAASLAAMAAQWRDDAAALREAAIAQDAHVPDLAGISESLAAVCARLEEVRFGVQAAGAALCEDETAIRTALDSGRQDLDQASAALQEAARDTASVARAAAAMVQRIEQASPYDLPRDELAEGIAAAVEATIAPRADALAALVAEAAQLVASLSAASPAPASADMARAILAELGPALRSQAPDPEALQAVVTHMQSAMARMQDGAAAQERAVALVTQAAAQIAAGLSATPERDMAAPPVVNLARLNGLAAEADALHAQADRLAQAALRPDGARVAAAMASEAPKLLAVIETSIQRLRGAAAALERASDTARAA
jgi:hypothetical protein